MGNRETRPAIPWWRGWGPVLVLPPAAVIFAPPDWPRWAFMWLLCVALFAGVKWLTWRRTPAPAASLGRHVGYLILWPGLDAAAFLRGPAVQRPTRSEWLDACVKLALGTVILWGVVRFIPEEVELLRGWVGMIGIVLALHFGPFHLLSCAWRAAGVDARRLMNAPLLAQGVSEFWGRRWNTAFRDLTHRFLFRPLTARLGPVGGLTAGFVFSGLVHDLAISVPAGAGYGEPTLYFCLQVPAILVERSRFGRALGLGRGWRGWLFAAVVLIAPVGLLFHPPFVRNVILQFLLILRVDHA
jgi:alginate O-acetyltransferase complex protein AlgI